MSDEEKLSLFDTFKVMKFSHYASIVVTSILSYWGARIAIYFLGIFIYKQVGREQIAEWIPELQLMTEAQMYQHWFDDPLVNSICFGIAIVVVFSKISGYGNSLAPKNKSETDN